MTPLNAREWLEALRAANGPEADFAAEILDTWCTEDEIEEHDLVKEAQRTATQAEDDLSDFEEELASSRFASEFIAVGSGTAREEFAKFLEYVADQDEQLEAVRQVLVNGGILRERDDHPALAGIVAMFVPPVVVGAG